MKKFVVFVLGLALLVVILGSFFFFYLKGDNNQVEIQNISEPISENSIFSNWKVADQTFGKIEISDYTDVYGQEFYKIKLRIEVEGNKAICTIDQSKEVLRRIFFIPDNGLCDYTSEVEVPYAMVCFGDDCLNNSFVEYKGNRFYDSIKLSIKE